jgi:hypothetical protein
MTTQSEKAITTQGASLPQNPFQRSNHPAHVNAGTIAIEEQRAIAEAQGKLIVAKRFPRDEFAAFEKVMNSCKRKSLAEASTYAFPRAGQTVSGPSIRLAEELARAWGNIDYGIRELSQRQGESEMEAYCWDLETNVFSSQKFTVKHERHTRSGVSALVDPRDIYELTANQASRRLRARILAVLPPDLVEKALEECSKTLAGTNNEPIAERVKKMLTAFSRMGITAKHVEGRLGKPLTNILPEEIAKLVHIHNSLRDNMSKASDWFNVGGEEAPPATNVNEKVKQLKEAKKTPASTPKQEAAKQEQPAPTPKPEPEPTAQQTIPQTQPAAEEVPAPFEGVDSEDEELM